jgi:hypothetical protein
MMTGLPCTAVRPSAAPAENEDDSRHRILSQSLFTQCSERIDAFSEIDRFAGEQNPELRDELNHRSYEWRKSKQSLEIIVS